MITDTGWLRVLTGFILNVDLTSIATVTSVEFNITVTGARPGDVVLATPSIRHSTGATLITAGYYAYVSALNTVTVQVFNQSAGPIDPPDDVNWRAIVFQVTS